MPLLWLWAAEGFAAPCADPLTVEEFREIVDRADEALDNDDVIAHGETWRTIKQNIDCLGEPLPKDDWARYLIGYAIVRHATGEPWRASLITALRIDPDISRDFGHPDIRLFPVPPDEELRGLKLAEGEAFLLDGLAITEAPPYLTGPHILQLAGKPYKTRLLIDAEFPGDWLAPPEPQPTTAPAPEPLPEPEESPRRPPRKGTLAAGLALGVAGSTLGVGTWLASTATSDPIETDSRYHVLAAVNAAGWTVAGLGGAMTGMYLGRSLTVRTSGRSVHFDGRF